MKVFLLIVGVVVGLVLVVVAIGYSLPVKHRGQGEAAFSAPPDSVFSLITNVEAFPSWRPEVKSAERLPPRDGKQRFREVSNNGTISYLIETLDPPRRMVTRIDDKALPFGGSWTYEVIPMGSTQSTLRITEDGEIYNPVFRFVGRFILGYDGTIKQYLANAKRRLG
ncbi:MAG TPA: SRPBCC family protein [Gemmatimonadaceae bacterium]